MTVSCDTEMHAPTARAFIVVLQTRNPLAGASISAAAGRAALDSGENRSFRIVLRIGETSAGQGTIVGR